MYQKYIKRILDILLSLLAIVILSPIYIIVGILVLIFLGRPIIFKQERPGKDEKIFTLYKFRSMTNKKDKEGNLLPFEERITKFGKFLRKTSLDEIPEFFNILNGDMSFVGPRPLLVEYLKYYTEEEHHRHDVRPGLTGLAQVNGRNFVKWDDRLRMDVEYVKNITFLQDLKIIFLTIKNVILRKNIISADKININGYILRPLNIERGEKMKFKEIGSNYSLENLPNEKEKFHVDFNKSNTFFLDSGRSAIRLVLDNLVVDKKVALLPYYTCQVVIEPFLEDGYQVYYYDIKKNLTLDEENLFKMIKEVSPSIILINSYFGKDILKNIRSKLSNQKTYIIEDITHTILTDNVDSSTSDFVVGSLRKWCAIPDGGYLKNNTNIKIQFDNVTENSDYVNEQIKAFLLKNDYIKTLDKSIKDEYMSLFSNSKKILDNNRKIFQISNITKSLLNSFDFEEIKKKRRDNYNYLYDNLLSIKFLKMPLGKIDKNTTPLYLPLYIKENRKKFQEYMAKQEIYMPIIWPKYDKLPDNDYIANEIYNEIICIPCDQRYSLDDMKRIVEAIKQYERSEIK